MTPRERVLSAVRHEKPDKAPKEAGFTPAIYEIFREKTGSDDPSAYFGMETRSIGFRGPEAMPDFTPYLEGLPEDTVITGEYGTMARPAHYFHFSQYLFPLRNAATVEEVEAYPWPDMAPESRHVHLEADVARLHEMGFFVDGFAGHIFETSWQIIGFEKWFEDILLNPDLVECVLDHITRDNCFRARRMAEAGVDMMRYGDDVGMQDRLMMKPEHWRKWLKPRLAREIQAARDVRPDIPCWYHSDGDISLIIDDLADVGITVLNPVQPECLDIQWLKKRYGGRLAFWGTVGTQTVMPFGKPEGVRRAVREMIELFGPALVVAPTHVLEPDVPWENIQAFFDAVEAYGVYK
ncbi:MAG: hypothetical protein IT210_08385 [Armatimonadetes bacterium]|nr:hypothetical protein [Armatimonadota bacterium]